MKAAILKKLNSPLVIDEIAFPDLQCGQVLVDVKVSGICGAQIGEIAGSKGEDKYIPHLLGHEGAGIVIEIGIGVSHVKPGDHVVMHWRKGAGIEAQPPRYYNGSGTIGGGWITTFNERAIISENRLTSIDKDIPFDVAALMGCAVTTGLGLINNEAKLKMGQSIAIAGCGGVGLNIVQGAAMVSADPIIAIDLFPKKLEMAEEFGATHLVDSQGSPDKFTTAEALRCGVDVFVDCTGLPQMINSGMGLLKPEGKMILVGQPRYSSDLILSNFRKHYCGKTIMDSQGGLTNPNKDIPRYLNLYKAGKLKLDELITHRYCLEQVNNALDKVRSGEAGRCILEMNCGC